MNHQMTDSLLNDLLVEIHRSLVQYAAEAWPWSTDQASDLQGAVLSVAERQRQDVGRLVHFLMDRSAHVDFGLYPPEFTSLHYVAIEYLYGQLIENQRSLVRLLDHSIGNLSTDPDAQRLVSQIAISQREGLQKLLSVEVPGGPTGTVWMK